MTSELTEALTAWLKTVKDPSCNPWTMKNLNKYLRYCMHFSIIKINGERQAFFYKYDNGVAIGIDVPEDKKQEILIYRRQVRELVKQDRKDPGIYVPPQILKSLFKKLYEIKKYLESRPYVKDMRK